MITITLCAACSSDGGGNDGGIGGGFEDEDSDQSSPPPTTAPPIQIPPPVGGPGSSLSFTVNEANVGSTINYDYGLQMVIPEGFGVGEFTFELWIKADNSFPFGATESGDDQRVNWTNVPADPQPSDGYGWWWEGNFLLDGHSNDAGFGTFSLQFYGGGRIRWHFYDSVAEWGVQATDVDLSPIVVDGLWHQITLVRRWVGDSDAALELWIDGELIAEETTSARDNMRDYWENWVGFLNNNEGWFWGAEKQAAIGSYDQYEDYKGLIDEVRLWSRAKSVDEIQDNYMDGVTGGELGLVGLFQFSEGAGAQTCNNINPNAMAEGDCIDLFNMKVNYWSSENAPIN